MRALQRLPLLPIVSGVVCGKGGAEDVKDTNEAQAMKFISAAQLHGSLFFLPAPHTITQPLTSSQECTQGNEKQQQQQQGPAPMSVCEGDEKAAHIADPSAAESNVLDALHASGMGLQVGGVEVSQAEVHRQVEQGSGNAHVQSASEVTQRDADVSAAHKAEAETLGQCVLQFLDPALLKAANGDEQWAVLTAGLQVLFYVFGVLCLCVSCVYTCVFLCLPVCMIVLG